MCAIEPFLKFSEAQKRIMSGSIAFKKNPPTHELIHVCIPLNLSHMYYVDYLDSELPGTWFWKSGNIFFLGEMDALSLHPSPEDVPSSGHEPLYIFKLGYSCFIVLC